MLRKAWENRNRHHLAKTGTAPILLLMGLLFFFPLGTAAQQGAQSGDGDQSSEAVTYQSSLIWRTDQEGDYILLPMSANEAYELIDPIITRGNITSINANWEFTGDVRLEISADDGLNFIPAVNGVPVSTSDTIPLITGNRLKWRLIIGADSTLTALKISYSDTSGVIGSFGAPQLSGFTKRKLLRITNPSKGELFNYQVKIKAAESSTAVGYDAVGFDAIGYDVDFEGNIGTQFKDIRFTALDGETVLPHFLEKITLQGGGRVAHFWITIPQIPVLGVSIYAYYNNPDAVTTSDGYSVFGFNVSPDPNGDRAVYNDWLSAYELEGIKPAVGLAGSEKEVHPAEFLNTTVDMRGNLVLSYPGTTPSTGQYITRPLATDCNISAITPSTSLGAGPSVTLDISADGGDNWKNDGVSGTTYLATEQDNFTPGQSLQVRANLPAPSFGEADGEITSITTGYSVGPGITSSHIDVTGTSGVNGAFKAGDTVIVKWDNSSAGDNNAGILKVTGDFSTLDGPTKKMKDKKDKKNKKNKKRKNIYTARYKLPPGLDKTANIFVTASNQCGSTTRNSPIFNVNTTSESSLRDTECRSNLDGDCVAPSELAKTEDSAKEKAAKALMKKKRNMRKRYKVKFGKDEAEIGDFKTTDFRPHAKIKRWGEETYLIVEMPSATGGGGITASDDETVEKVTDKIEWDSARSKTRFYKKPRKEITKKFVKKDEFFPWIKPTGTETTLHTFVKNENGGLEFEVILKEIPTSNVVHLPIRTKGLRFHYQGPLTQKETDQGVVRPDEIEGSYAVYHESKKDGIYGTGKAFHIYRPKIIDNNGDWVWGELHISTDEHLHLGSVGGGDAVGHMEITIDRDWLATAAYPVIVDPEFGYTTIGSSSVSINNVIKGSKFTPAAMNPRSITAYIENTDSSNHNAKYGIYKVSGGALTAQTAAVTIPASSTAWYTGLYTASPNLSAEEYILAARGDNANLRIYFDAGVTDQGASESLTYASAWPADTTGFTYDTNKYSIYSITAFNRPVTALSAMGMKRASASYKITPGSLGQFAIGNATNNFASSATFIIYPGYINTLNDTIPPHAPGVQPVATSFTATGGSVVSANINNTNTGFTVQFFSPATEHDGTAHLYVGGVDFATPITVTTSAGSTLYTLTGNSTSITELGSDGSKALTVVIVDAAGNVGTASNTLTITKDLVDPVVSALALSPSSGTRKVGETVTLTITADAAGYTSSVVTVNTVAVTGFTDAGAGSYTATYTIVNGNTDASSGNLPASVVLSDSAGNTNTAFTTVTSNSLSVDANRPTITSATMDYNDGTLVITANESIDQTPGSNVDLSKIHVNNATGTDSVTLTGAAVTASDGTTITITLTEAQRIAAIAISGTGGGDGGAVVLDVDAAAVQDIAGNTNLIDDNNTVSETADTTKPTLSTWDLNMNTGVITLNFSETIDASATDATKVILQNAATVTGGKAHTLTGGTASVTDAAQITITLSTADSNAIKAIELMSKASGNSFIRFSASAVTDMATNTIAAVANGSAVGVTTYTADTTKPTLSTWDLNMNTGVITLNYSETVDASLTDATKFTIQDAATATAGKSYTLTGGTVSSTDAAQITITLTTADSNAIKAIESMAKASGNSYLRFTAVAVTDMAAPSANTIAAVADGSAVGVTTYTADTTAPTLSTWNLNMDTGVITLNFSETIDASLTDTTKFTIQDAASATAGKSYTLSGGTASTADLAQITITLSVVDRDAIRGTVDMADASANSYIRFAAVAVTDMAAPSANTIAAVANGSAVAVTTYTVDTTSVTYKVEIQSAYDSTNNAINAASWLTRNDILTLDDSSATISLNVYDSGGTKLNSTDMGTSKTIDTTTGMFTGMSYTFTTDPDPSQIYTLKATITYKSNTYTSVATFIVPSVFNYAVKVDTLYDSDADSMKANAWLERDGVTVTKPGDMTIVVRNDAGTAVNTQNFDGYDTSADATFASILTNGVYSGIEWDPSGGITINVIHSVKASIIYNGKTYNGTSSFSKGELGTIGTDVTTLQTNLTGVTSDVSAVATQVSTVESSVGTVTTKVNSVVTDVDSVLAKLGAVADTASTTSLFGKLAKVLTAAETTLPARIAAIKTDISTVNTAVGDIPADITEVQGTTSAILGQLSGVSSDVDDIASSGDALISASAKIAALGTQFAILEAAMTNIDTTNISQSMIQMQALYDNLSSMAEKIKEVSTVKVEGWDDMFNMSQEQSTNMQYLKNKTQELKAMVEMNQTLVENVAQEKSEPVTQTWLEFY